MYINLVSVGLAYLIGSLVGLGFSIKIWRKLTPELGISIKKIHKPRLQQLATMGGWLLVDQIGVLLLLHIDLIFVNKLFGCTSAGEYASVQQWSKMVSLLGHAFAVVLTPVMLILYANQERDRIINMAKSSVKFMGLVMALPIGLICGFSSPLLLIWLGPEYKKLAPLMLLLIGHRIISSSVLPLFPINVAANKVKIPSIVTLSTGLGNIILALVFALGLSWGLYGVGAAGAITITLRNVLFSPWYTSKILEINQNLILKSMLPGVIWGIIMVCVCSVINRYYLIGNWGELIIVCGMLSFIYVIAVWVIGLNREERVIAMSFLPTWILAKRQEMNG
jgi:membrane protein EpsK